MLLASILKVFYWIGARYDLSLLIQAVLMIAVQVLLLHVALSNRPPPPATPFAASDPKSLHHVGFQRPYNFWQWRSSRPYWTFLTYFTVTLLCLQVLIGSSERYTSAQGYVALAIEAILPLPQIIANQRRRSCIGFRVSVLANWLLGDAFKMTFFFLKANNEVPWAFKACGLFQAACDCYLGIQYAMFGNQPQPDIPAWEKKEEEMGFVPVGQPVD